VEDDEVDEGSSRKEIKADENYAKYLIDGIKNDAIISAGVNLSYLLAGFPAAEISVKIPKTPLHITGGVGVRVIEGYMMHNEPQPWNDGILTGEFQSGSGYFAALMFTAGTFGFTSGSAIGLKYRSLNSKYIFEIEKPLSSGVGFEVKKYNLQVTRHFFVLPVEYKYILDKNFFTSIGYEFGVVRAISNNSFDREVSKLLNEPYKPTLQHAFYQNITLSFGYLIK
jgi:hypothetical protein